MRKTPLKPGKRIRRYTPIKKRNRTGCAFDRIYGSQARAKIMRERPCDTCGREATMERPNENAHVVGGGMGRKSDWTNVVTLCPSDHRALHGLGSAEAFERTTDLRAIARRLAVELAP